MKDFLDLRKYDFSIDLLDQLSTNKTVCATIPMEKCISLDLCSFLLGAKSQNPYFLTARALLSNKKLAYHDSPLRKWHETVRPKTCAELMGLPAGANENLESLSPDCADFPWRSAPCNAIKEKRATKIKRKSVKQFNFEIEKDARWEQFGPIGGRLAELEFKRIKWVVDSVLELGYDPEKMSDFMIVDLLLDANSDYRINVSAGQHRGPVLAAIGLPSFPALLRPQNIYHRDTLNRCPAINAGIMTYEEVTSVFDRVFRAEQPAFLRDIWPPDGLE